MVFGSKQEVVEKVVLKQSDNVGEDKEENLKLVNIKESHDIQEKQNYIKEIEDVLSEIHFSIKHKNINEYDLSGIIQEINDKATNLQIDNYVLNLVHELIFVNFRTDLPLYHTVPWRKILILIFLAVLYICDIFANIILCVIYTIDKKYLYSVLTLSFYIIPSIFITILVLKRLQILNISWICIICNLSPVICCFHSLNIASKISSERKKNNMEEQISYYNDLKEMYTILDKVKQFVGFLHCGPQLTLQLAISLYLCRNGACPTNLTFQILLLTTSFFGLIVAMETRFNRKIFENLWLFPIIVARILSICILVFRFLLFTTTFLFLHWLIVACCWYYQKVKTMESQSKIEKILISASEAVISTFIPVNFSGTDIHLYLYIIHFIENILANVIWALTLTKNDHSSYIYALVIGINITYFLFGSFCKFLSSRIL